MPRRNLPIDTGALSRRTRLSHAGKQIRPFRPNVPLIFPAGHKRKNWLFVGNEEGGHVNTVFVSLLASCAMHRIEPWAYLRDLLCLIPRWPVHEVLDLAPVNWPSTFAREDVQAKLTANVYRAATLTQG